MRCGRIGSVLNSYIIFKATETGIVIGIAGRLVKLNADGRRFRGRRCRLLLRRGNGRCLWVFDQARQRRENGVREIGVQRYHLNESGGRNDITRDIDRARPSDALEGAETLDGKGFALHHGDSNVGNRALRQHKRCAGRDYLAD